MVVLRGALYFVDKYFSIMLWGILVPSLVQLGGEHLSSADVGLNLHGLSFVFLFASFACAFLALPSFGFLALPWVVVFVFVLPLLFSCGLLCLFVFCVLLPSVLFPFWFSPIWGDCLSFPLSGDPPGIKVVLLFKRFFVLRADCK